ncbi:hypothetical protein C8034_v005886 [Colletotrichum sidae]|uniref:Uncharacterized protein n=1 Tax=Colletotrichum sidae TaxID=1347389 RepID=A0A4R8TQC2_9PEZI|nr:hypothetical protein C8034_v005886 [Colletotrichum sidae]
MMLSTDTVDFKNENSLLYFNEFIALVRSPWTSAASDGDLWTVMLPQLARNSSPLRSAAMAIGALSTWHRKSTRGSLRTVSLPETQTKTGDAHYFDAVAHYCQSLKQQASQPSVQDAVVLSVLLLFFETLRDNRKAALDHINHGLSLLLALLTDKDAQDRLASLAPNPKPLLGAIGSIFNYLTPQIRTVLRGRIHQGPSLPHFHKALSRKQHTVESFMVLLSQLPNSAVAGVPDDIPPVFHTLDEFERSWGAVRRAQTALMPLMVHILRNSDMFHSNSQQAIESFQGVLFTNERIAQFCDRSSRALEALDAAFQPLFQKIIVSEPPTSAVYLRAVHLRLQHLGTYVFDNPPQYADAASINARLPLFREYLSVASVALRAAKREVARNPAHQLSLQCHLSWHLLVVALFCRDPLTRDEAVGLLAEYPGQDGLWSTCAVYAIAKRNREVERRNAAGGGTPDEQWRRLWRREFVFEDGGDRVILRYLDWDEGAQEWRLVEEAADVRGDGEDAEWKQRPVSGCGGLLMVELFSGVDHDPEREEAFTDVSGG